MNTIEYSLSLNKLQKLQSSNFVKEKDFILAGGILSLMAVSRQAEAQFGSYNIYSATGQWTSPDNQAPILGGGQAPLGPIFLNLNTSARLSLEIGFDVTGATYPLNIQQNTSLNAFFVFDDGEEVELPPPESVPWFLDDSTDVDEDLTPSSNNKIYLYDTPGKSNLIRSSTSPFASWNPGEKGVFLYNFSTWVENASTGQQIFQPIDWHIEVIFSATANGWDPTITPPSLGAGHKTTP